MKLLLCFLLSTAAWASPELPRVKVDTSLPLQAGSIVNVNQGDNLQLAINNAKPGDTLVLSGTFTGNFNLPAKENPDGKWIVIKGSNPPIAGQRMDLSKNTGMPRLLSPNATPVIVTKAKASYYRLIGLEVGITEAVSLSFGLIEFGTNTVDQSTLDVVPHHLIVDRCYIHGNPLSHAKRGVNLNSATSAVIDSYISEIHGWGQDTQAIAGANGPGPFKIVNNYLEGAGENILFGGSDPAILGLVPSDIEVKRNLVNKPMIWRSPVVGAEAKGPWLVKNLFELKNAQRVLIEGNSFQNCWNSGQTGFAILFTPRNQDGKCPWCVVQDVTFQNNLIEHAGSGFSIMGTDSPNVSAHTTRIAIKNNLLNDINGKTYGSYGTCALLDVKDLSDLVYDHNSCFQSQHAFMYGQHHVSGYDSMNSLVYTNNLSNHNSYGFFGDNSGIGLPSIQIYFPNAVFSKNVLVRNILGVPRASQYPQASVYPDITGLGFVIVSNLSEADSVLGVGVNKAQLELAMKEEEDRPRSFFPAVPGNWMTDPHTILEALDELAARIK